MTLVYFLRLRGPESVSSKVSNLTSPYCPRAYYILEPWKISKCARSSVEPGGAIKLPTGYRK